MLWHTSSLLQVVVAAARSCPLRRDGTLSLKRLVDATSALGALGCRGLDPELLVRRGLGQKIKLALAAWLGRWSEQADDPRSSWEYIDRWRAFFEEGADGRLVPDGYIDAALDGVTAQRLDAWIELAPMEDIFLWRPPDSNTGLAEARLLNEDVEGWRWIVERFTETYLEQWSLTALKREYSYVQGSWVPDFPAVVLAERTVTREQVATALADRAMIGDDVVDPYTMNSFTDQALVLLADEQRTAAAALFDAARKLKPADIAAQNNYAFCILLDKPGQARDLLTDALSRGVPNPTVTWCNLALAESLLGHSDAALRACDQAYGISTREGKQSYLWQRRGGSWVVQSTNPRSWVIHFGAELEKLAGTAAIWAERLEGINLSEPQGPSGDPSSAETGGEDP